MTDSTIKTCNKCGEVKPLGAFSTNRAEKDGLLRTCRACMKERNDAKVAAQRAAGSAVIAAGEKPCATCKVVKPLDEFYVMQRAMDGRRKECITCATPARTEKKCGKCLEVKPLEDFSNNRKTPDGKGGYCKPCGRVASAAHKVDNPDRSRDYYLANRESILARMRERYEEDPGKYLIKGRKRRLSIQLMDLGDVHIPTVRVMRPDCYLCGNTLSGDTQVDHVVPLSRGGLHARSNVLPTHAECNLRKHDRLLSELAWYTGPVIMGAASRAICA